MSVGCAQVRADEGMGIEPEQMGDEGEVEDGESEVSSIEKRVSITASALARRVRRCARACMKGGGIWSGKECRRG